MLWLFDCVIKNGHKFLHSMICYSLIDLSNSVISPCSELITRHDRLTVCFNLSNGNVASWCLCYGCPLCMLWMFFWDCALIDSHRVFIMVLLQFELCYEFGPIVDASLNRMDSPNFDYLGLC
jgi:hypothetical protein